MWLYIPIFIITYTYVPKNDLQPILTCRIQNSATQKTSAMTFFEFTNFQLTFFVSSQSTYFFDPNKKSLTNYGKARMQLKFQN